MKINTVNARLKCSISYAWLCYSYN